MMISMPSQLIRGHALRSIEKYQGVDSFANIPNDMKDLAWPATG